jgi:hypothetical protein
VEPLRIRQYGREQGSIGDVELRGARAEVLARRRLDAEYAGPELGDIEVHLENALLRPAHLDQHGEIRLERLAHEAAALPEKEILRDLLRDRRGAAQAVAAAVLFERSIEGDEVDAAMRDEALILGRDDGARGAPCNLVAVDPDVVELAYRARLKQHDRRRRRSEPTQRRDGA